MYYNYQFAIYLSGCYCHAKSCFSQIIEQKNK